MGTQTRKMNGLGTGLLVAPVLLALLLLGSVLLGWGVPTALAEGSLWQEFALECAAKQDSLERLTCYDRVATKMQAAMAKVGKSANTGNWVLEEEVDPITDKSRVVVFMRDKEFNPFNRPYILNIRCEKKKLEVYIHWERFLGDGEEIEVITRLDKATPESAPWHISRDKNAAFFTGNPEALTQALVGAKVLLARVTPPQAREITANFPLEGLVDALKPIQAACPFVTLAK